MPSSAFELTAGEASLSLVPGCGGLIHALVLPTAVGPRNVIAGVDPSEWQDNPGYRGSVLFPFPNRLRDGRYRFAGREYQFLVNEQATGTALHGFLYRTPAEVLRGGGDDEAQTVTLVYACDATEPGYPFSARVSMTYTLCASGGLSVEMSVENRDSRAIPVGMGWHPYYTLGVRLDACRLELPPVERVLVDKRMLPTGERVSDTRFAGGGALQEVVLDDCFDLGSEPGRAAAVFTSRTAGFGLELWQETGPGALNFMQLYTPPDRQSLAVEPMSCGIDALNTGEGLRILEPGQSVSGTFGVRVIGC